MPLGGTDSTTRMKILLAPSWDHNFAAGPGRWLAGSGQGMTGLGDQDNYYPGTANIAKESSEPWWPAETMIFDPSQRFCWDADNRGVTQTAFAYGTGTGALRRNFSSGAGFTEEESTRNRLRGTGSPIDSWNKSDTTFVNTSTFLFWSIAVSISSIENLTFSNAINFLNIVNSTRCLPKPRFLPSDFAHSNYSSNTFSYTSLSGISN